MVRRDSGVHRRLPSSSPLRPSMPPAEGPPTPRPVLSHFVPLALGDCDFPARERAGLDFDPGFSAQLFSFLLEGRDCAPRFRFARTTARTATNSFRPSTLIWGSPSVM